MKKDTLYLHVGWSKTGTSAIQSQIQRQQNDFLQKGILYPQSLQWPDHSHHPFALSFKSSGVYRGDMTPAQVLEKLNMEMRSSPADSVLLSSELSPFYFNNPRFAAFVDAKFTHVKVIFTIRPQSELLLSLFNQLVKDPAIRYGASVFTLAMRNISWLNFYQNIKQWSNVVGNENITVIPYSSQVVHDFFQKFGVAVYSQSGKGPEIINPSLPNRCLALLQERGRKATGPADFLQIRSEVLREAEGIPEEKDKFNLFTDEEQKAYDDYFRKGNELLMKDFRIEPGRFFRKTYRSVMAIPPWVS